MLCRLCTIRLVVSGLKAGQTVAEIIANNKLLELFGLQSYVAKISHLFLEF